MFARLLFSLGFASGMCQTQIVSCSYLTVISSAVVHCLKKVGEPTDCHGLHKMLKIASGPQILFSYTFKFYLYLPKENRKRKLCQGARGASF